MCWLFSAYHRHCTMLCHRPNQTSCCRKRSNTRFTINCFGASAHQSPTCTAMCRLHALDAVWKGLEVAGPDPLLLTSSLLVPALPAGRFGPFLFCFDRYCFVSADSVSFRPFLFRFSRFCFVSTVSVSFRPSLFCLDWFCFLSAVCQ